MDPQVQASFIPKKPLVAGVAASRTGRIGLLWFASVVLFVGSLAASAGVFLYTQYLKSAIEDKDQSLSRAQAAYDPRVIEDLLRLNDRLALSKSLLQNHLAPSTIFDFLADNTLSNVRFTNFNYLQNPSGAASLSLSGVAQDFPSVALQSDQFGRSRELKDVLFSDVNIDPQTGNVVFKVSAQIDPSLILYRNFISQNVIGGTSVENVVTASTTDN